MTLYIMLMLLFSYFGRKVSAMAGAERGDYLLQNSAFFFLRRFIFFAADGLGVVMSSKFHFVDLAGGLRRRCLVNYSRVSPLSSIHVRS